MKIHDYDRCKKMANHFTTKSNKIPKDTRVVAFGELIKIVCHELEVTLDIANVFETSNTTSTKYLKEAKFYLNKSQVLIESYRTHMDNLPVQIMLPEKSKYWNFIFYTSDRFTESEEYKNLMGINMDLPITDYLLEEMGRRIKLARICSVKSCLEAARMFGKSKESFKILYELQDLLSIVKDKMDEVAFSELVKKGYKSDDIINIFYGDKLDMDKLITKHFIDIIESDFTNLFPQLKNIV